MPKLGVIADDFTGAADAASFLANAGVNTLLYDGVPRTISLECDAAVIALKSRSQPVAKAVTASLEALEVLQRSGTQRFYFKYCSTFDSTPQGNIGPVIDALMEQLDLPATVLAPALPVNGRTVRDGILYVQGIPLAESPMKDHPLNPMWASQLAELMRLQGRYRVVTITRRQLGDSVMTSAFKQHSIKNRVYYVPDYETDKDAECILRHFENYRLLTGASALLGAWGRRFGGSGQKNVAGIAGRCLLLAGSCSNATRAQVRAWKKAGNPAFRIAPEILENGADDIIRQLLPRLLERDSLVYSSADHDEVCLAKAKAPDIGSKLEQWFARLAAVAAESGIKRWIVAGGETSGAVMQALGIGVCAVGPDLAPGVPMLIPLEKEEYRIVLKSGNFGQEDFFLRACERTGIHE